MILTDQMVYDFIGDKELTMREIVSGMFGIDQTDSYSDYKSRYALVNKHVRKLRRKGYLDVRKSDICVNGAPISYYKRRYRCAYSTLQSTLTIQNRKNSISSGTRYSIA